MTKKRWWQVWKRDAIPVSTPPLQWRGEEEYSVPELGGRVALRGLTAAEMSVATRGAETLPTTRNRRAMLGVALLLGGIVYPRLDVDGAIQFVKAHPDRAMFLIGRIRRLSEQRLRETGLIR
jgi:hypothetical protein